MASALPPYPDPELLLKYDMEGCSVRCHACSERDRANCRACLGSGWLRPCARCHATGQTGHRPCLICGGNRYTASDAPSPVDTEPHRAAYLGDRRAHYVKEGRN